MADTRITDVRDPSTEAVIAWQDEVDRINRSWGDHDKWGDPVAGPAS